MICWAYWVKQRDTYTSEETRSRAAHLQVVLADLRSVEHRVKARDFVDLHWSHLEDLGDLVHRRESQEVVVLLLSDKQNWDHARRLVVAWVLLLQDLNCRIRLVRELEWRLLKVVLGVAVVCKRTEPDSGRLENRSHGYQRSLRIHVY